MLIQKDNILTRFLPKSGQTTSYAAGDDGDHEAGWWKELSSLENRTRFVQRTISGDIVIVDRATGLMWPQNWSAAGGNNGNPLNWANAITWANSLNFAGFTDWRLPNNQELISTADYGHIIGASYDIFNNVVRFFGERYWSSTTCAIWTIRAWTIDFWYGDVNHRAKTDSHYVVAVRDYK